MSRFAERRNSLIMLWNPLGGLMAIATAQRTVRSERSWHQNSLRKVGETAHVAAVCYRVRDDEIEFLLVKTRAGRWTFPKGRVEDDATRAAAAAREAYEEAGVHGHVDTLPFATYLHSKSPHIRATHAELRIEAHLCYVYGLVAPEESYRNPTWFSPNKAKRRLHDDRRFHYGSELSAVIDSAVERIARRHSKSLQ